MGRGSRAVQFDLFVRSAWTLGPYQADLYRPQHMRGSRDYWEMREGRSGEISYTVLLADRVAWLVIGMVCQHPV